MICNRCGSEYIVEDTDEFDCGLGTYYCLECLGNDISKSEIEFCGDCEHHECFDCPKKTINSI